MIKTTNFMMKILSLSNQMKEIKS